MRFCRRLFAALGVLIAIATGSSAQQEFGPDPSRLERDLQLPSLTGNAATTVDINVNEVLSSWRIPESDLTPGDPVTLRRLLSMIADIGVPGYVGYAPGAPVPSLAQILDRVPPANSPPVRVEHRPGT